MVVNKIGAFVSTITELHKKAEGVNVTWLFVST